MSETFVPSRQLVERLKDDMALDQLESQLEMWHGHVRSAIGERYGSTLKEADGGSLLDVLEIDCSCRLKVIWLEQTYSIQVVLVCLSVHD